MTFGIHFHVSEAHAELMHFIYGMGDTVFIVNTISNYTYK